MPITRRSSLARAARRIAPALILAALVVPELVAAQSLRPLGNVTIPQIIGRVVKGILGILGSVSLLMFVYGGMTWMMAAGNEEKIKKAKNTIVYAVLGLIVAFLAYQIVRVLFTKFGF